MPAVPRHSYVQRATGTINQGGGLQAQGRNTSVASSLEQQLAKYAKDLSDNTASKPAKIADGQGTDTGGAAAAAPQQVLFPRIAEGSHHALYLLVT